MHTALHAARALPPLPLRPSSSFSLLRRGSESEGGGGGVDTPTPVPATSQEWKGEGEEEGVLTPLAVLLDGPFTDFHVSALMLASYMGHTEVGWVGTVVLHG